ncbi:MAG: homoserine O-acetyltransferase/O-succinyltransferase family protein, partial [Candidatus Wenzhouxiangella sp. M2_3B_020]
MPLVAHSGLPTFSELAEHGHDLVPADRAIHQDIRELHIGFLNMMPDAALKATERQFIRLVGACNRIVQFYVYPFSLPEIERSAETRAYIAEHYSSFDELSADGLDALIITGANVANPALAEEPFWKPLAEVAH